MSMQSAAGDWPGLAAASPLARRRRVVVVDDDPGMNQAIRRLLDAAGFLVLTFSSGEALLKGKAATTADCMILDVTLPGMSGFELQQRLKDSGVNTPFILVTAHDSSSVRERAERAGAVAYLPKPFIGRTLLEKVCHALRPVAPHENGLGR